ncbi:hypothetical protein C8R46DRAFT_1223037 [Mycena filopes]|nr:hypothetical protein C8R46DRAFT_1223037 [Mycena filopes]
MEESTAPELTREETLWFPDATLVLQAGNRLYRLFPGILAAKSLVFQDMLAFPQPATGETFDGCPLVRLSDRADDVTYFLKAIFHYDFFEAWPVQVEFPIFAANLRLSQKYQVEPLRKRALVHLSERCAPSWEKWEEFYDWDVNPIELLNLAREVSAHWVLPQAFSACCLLDPMLLVSGWPTADVDGNMQTVILDISRHTPLPVRRDRDAHHLDLDTAPCLTARVSYQKDAEEWRSAGVSVLKLWNELDWDNLKVDVCSPCSEFMHASHAAAREEYWQALPKIFNMPNWNILLEQKRVELGRE